MSKTGRFERDHKLDEAGSISPSNGLTTTVTTASHDLVAIRPGCGWIFPQPKLGSEYVPDFMVCGLNSAGPHWHLIELENPNYSVLTKKGQQTAKLTHAMQQVKDWRIWLRKNIQYAQNQLGYIGLDSEFEAIIVMGRRKDLNPKHREAYRELSREKVQVMSYDRMVEFTTGTARSLCQSLDNRTKNN